MKNFDGPLEKTTPLAMHLRTVKIVYIRCTFLLSHNSCLQVLTTVSVPTSDSTYATHLSKANAVGVAPQKKWTAVFIILQRQMDIRKYEKSVKPRVHVTILKRKS